MIAGIRPATVEGRATVLAKMSGALFHFAADYLPRWRDDKRPKEVVLELH
jgi:hypothetical protein